MDIKYSNACKEVAVLFECFLAEEELSKIPSELLEHIRNNANPQYDYIIDGTKTLDEQKMSKEAKAIIVSLYKQYFANDEQKTKVDDILEKQKNIEQNIMYDFKAFEKNVDNKSTLKEDIETNFNKKLSKEESSLVKSEGMFKKIINRILNFWGRKTMK